MSHQVLDFVVGASLALLAASGLFRLVIARETYFVWIMPLFLMGMFAGMYAFRGSGSPAGQGAFAGLVDRTFHVETADVDRAKAFLCPRTREWLLANVHGDKVLVDGKTLMLCVGHQTMKQLPDLLDQIRALRATFA